jgi:4-diphosphocytidyl-2-C-methyl-D-erythritol kinase
MILFSQAKVNIGLHITELRPDGFRNLQSVMAPIGLCDILEIQPSASGKSALKFSLSGIPVEQGSGMNLVEKAHQIMASEVHLPPVDIHLHKQIPVGAGLGGGSSNATFTLLGLNRLLDKPLSLQKLHQMALSLGSDCPFFLHNQFMMMEGRGEILSPCPVNLDGLYLVLLFPGIHISTAEAYAGVAPAIPPVHLKELITSPVTKWKDLVVNDFEKGIFLKYPEISSLKNNLYEAGAIYASLSGSGSSLFGIFTEQPDIPDFLNKFVIWNGDAGRFKTTI